MIRLQFSTGVGFDLYSIAIRVYQHSGSPFTHVDAILPDGTLLGARDDGVKIRPADYQVFAHTCIAELPCDDATAQRFYDFLLKQIGKPYDWPNIFHMAAVNPDPSLPTPERDWREQSSWFCSELQSAALEVSGFFKYPLFASTALITPGDLALVCSAFCDIYERMKIVRPKA